MRSVRWREMDAKEVWNGVYEGAEVSAVVDFLDSSNDGGGGLRFIVIDEDR